MGEKEFITNKEYHSRPGLSKSGLMPFSVSPYHFRMEKEYQEPTDVFSVESKKFNVGTATHTQYLEPDKFSSEISLEPTVIGSKLKKENKLVLDGWKKDVLTTGKTPITQQQYQTIYNMYQELHYGDNGSAQGLLAADGETEISYFWKDPIYGFDCKCRVDKVFTDYTIPPVDFKTTGQGANHENFVKIVGGLKYHWQAWFYLEGIKQVEGREYDKFLFLVQETTPPYAVAVYQLGYDAIFAAEQQIEPLRRQYAECLETDIWPSFNNEVQLIEMKPWDLK